MRAVLIDLGKTQPEISREAGVSQAAVSRLLSACPSRYGGAFKKLCIYADVVRPGVGSGLPILAAEELLLSAVRETWNGTADHAQALAELIRAAGAVARVASRA